MAARQAHRLKDGALWGSRNEDARRRLAAARLLRRLGVSKATLDEAHAIQADIEAELATQGGRRKRGSAA